MLNSIYPNSKLRLVMLIIFAVQDPTSAEYLILIFEILLWNYSLAHLFMSISILPSTASIINHM